MDDFNENRTGDGGVRPASNPWSDTGRSTAQKRRRHMGVATSDPEYLEAVGRNARNHPANTPHHQLHYERYLETPKTGKSIFIARKERSRAHARLVILLAIIVIVAVLAWLFF